MKRGFTLVEMLGATALAAVLMVAAFQVLASLGRTRALLAGQEKQPPGVDRLAEAIRSDLVNARFIRPSDGRLDLVGFGGGAHRPATVTYSLRTAGGRGWLVREQVGERTGPARRAERSVQLCCGGVAAFRLELMPNAREDNAGEEPDEENPLLVAAVRRPPGFIAVPRFVRLVVRGEREGDPEASELIHVH